MGTSTKIIILGGGYAGIHVAKKLCATFKKDRSVEITLIDQNPYHTLMTELHEIAGHRSQPDAVQISFKRIFSGRRINTVSDEITSVNFEDRMLYSAHFTYEYDYLVLATGGEPEFFGVQGVQEHSFTLWSLEDAIRIREHVEMMFRNAAKEPSEAERHKLLNFVIAGAGFTGTELAGELLELRDVLCTKYHIDRNEVRVVIVEAQNTVLPVLPEGPRKAAQKYLEKQGADVRLGIGVREGKPGAVLLSDGSLLETETFVWTCGIQGSQFTARIPLMKGTVSGDDCSIATTEGIHGMSGCRFDEDERYIVGERGRILVTDQMRALEYSNIYLCGDMIWYLHDEKVVPQIVETAIQSAEVVAHNIIAAIKGRQAFKSFNPVYHGFMVSIGGRYGVAHVLGMNLYGFMAMASKHLINVHYLFEIAGFNAAYGYIKEEFLSIQNRRSILRGHASAKIPAFWALPARLWLGFAWLVEGVNKIIEGWFRFSGGSRSGWMFSPGVRQAGLAPAKAAGEVASEAAGAGSDALSAASEEWVEGTEAVGEVASEVASEVAGEAAGAGSDALSAASEEWVEGAEVAAEGVSEFVGEGIAAHAINFDQSILAWDSGIVTWFRETFMDGLLAYLPFQLFQVMIVGAELAIGLALLAGFLTVPAALASMGLVAIFIISGMFSWNQLWFVFLAIVMLGGAGHVAGLDHWFMPWLKTRWNSTALAHRSHLYVDEPVFRRKRKH